LVRCEMENALDPKNTGDFDKEMKRHPLKGVL
jgi:hypothetical protein